jgi:hypothetical protein
MHTSALEFVTHQKKSHYGAMTSSLRKFSAELVGLGSQLATSPIAIT